MYVLRNTEISVANKILGTVTVDPDKTYYSTAVVKISGLDLIDDKLDAPLVGPIPSIASNTDSLYLTNASGFFLKNLAMTGFSFGTGTLNTARITGLTQNTTYSGLRLYYKFASNQTHENYNYLTIPTFVTPPAFTLDAGFKLCIKKAVINISSIQYSGRELSSIYPVVSNQNTLSVWIYSSTDSSILTDYTNILVSGTTGNFAPVTAVVKTLVQNKIYDKIGFKYVVLNELGEQDAVTITAPGILKLTNGHAISCIEAFCGDRKDTTGEAVSTKIFTKENIQILYSLGGLDCPSWNACTSGQCDLRRIGYINFQGNTINIPLTTNTDSQGRVSSTVEGYLEIIHDKPNPNDYTIYNNGVSIGAGTSTSGKLLFKGNMQVDYVKYGTPAPVNSCTDTDGPMLLMRGEVSGFRNNGTPTF
jgi:hypothetical protein